ncbi:hypothetical protein [Kitasatospora paranensis]|uniref:Uncharacterized protein n=1 Tax=Kitasatospora paranensis TaxID=258053 RepID=A0ABW2G1W2_9ACTN
MLEDPLDGDPQDIVSGRQEGAERDQDERPTTGGQPVDDGPPGRIEVGGIRRGLLLHLALGTRIPAPLGSARTWLETTNAAVTSLVLALIGALLLADGAIAL